MRSKYALFIVFLVLISCQKPIGYTNVENYGGGWEVISCLDADGNEQLGSRDYIEGEIRFEFVDRVSGNFLHSYYYYKDATTVTQRISFWESNFMISDDVMSFDSTDIFGTMPMHFFDDKGMLHLSTDELEFLLKPE